MKYVKVLVLSFVFVFMFSSLAHAMSWEEFIETYPNEYIYRVDYPNGDRNYFSSPCELEFRMEGLFYGDPPEWGEGLVVYKASNATAYRLRNDGKVRSWSCERLFILADVEGADIWQWNGYSFFLPERSAFLRGLGGLTQMILPTGFGIVSVMLLVKLLAVYFRRYLNRL